MKGVKLSIFICFILVLYLIPTGNAQEFDESTDCYYYEDSITVDLIEPASNISNLVSLWLMNENAGSIASDSEDSNPATLIGTAAFVGGYYGNAVELDGNSDTLEIADNSNLEPASEIALSCWIYAHDIDGIAYQEIYRKEDGSNRVLFSFQDSGTTLAFGLNTGGYAELDVTIVDTDYDNQWVHLVATYDGSDKKVYRNGVEIGTQATTGLTTGGSAKAYIGSNAKGSEWFDGLVDDFRFYSKGLSPSEVTDLYNSYITNETFYFNYTETATIESIGVSGSITFSNSDLNFMLGFKNWSSDTNIYENFVAGNIDSSISTDYFNGTNVFLVINHSSTEPYVQYCQITITIYFDCEDNAETILIHCFIYLFILFFLFVFLSLKTTLRLTQDILFFFLLFLEAMLFTQIFTSVFYIYLNIALMTFTAIIYFEVVHHERE